MTVDLVLKATDPVLLTKLAGYGAMIVPPGYIKEKGEDYFNTHPVGTGPFKFVDYQPKVSLTLAANPDYWGGAPKIDSARLPLHLRGGDPGRRAAVRRHRRRLAGADQPHRDDQERSQARRRQHHRPDGQLAALQS